MTHAMETGERRKTIASSGGAARTLFRSRSLAYSLSATLAWGCSIYDMPAPRQNNPAGSGEGGSTGGDGGSGGTAATGVGGSGGSAATGSGTGGNQGIGGASGQAGNSGGRAGGAGSAGAGGTAGTSGAGGKQDDGGLTDVSSGGSSGGTEGGFAGGMEGGSSGGSVDAGDAPWEGAPPDAADSDADGCTPESNVAFCLRMGKNCGTVNGINNCGATVMFNCGSCTAPPTCGGAGQPNVCGSPTNVAKGGTVSSSSPGVSPEDMTKAFDENSATKWYAGDNVSKGWIAYQFASGVTRTVTSYTMTSANDMPARDPADWTLEGSNDGSTWLTLDTRTGQSFASRFLTKTYSCANTMAYGRYRLNVTANGGANALQLADLQLLGY